MTTRNIGPKEDEIEVSIIGPGFGESILIHYGGNKWIIVDSCWDAENNCAGPLAYLQSIGVSPDNVFLIVATHWHDDHVRGIADIYSRCANAALCLSSVMSRDELRRAVLDIARSTSEQNIKLSSGVNQLSNVLRLADKSNRELKYALADRLIFRCDQLPHGERVQVTSLSPNDNSINKFLGSIHSLISDNSDGRRVVTIKPNDAAVALWISIGEISILLGSDLEETHGGWSAIVSSNTRPDGRSSIFKIPHHGSQNGHHSPVWEHLLINNPICLLTPFNRAQSLPSNRDVERISSQSNLCYITKSRAGCKSKVKRDRMLEGLMNDLNIRPTKVINKPGIVRARRQNPFLSNNWEIELFDGACELAQYHPAWLVR